MENMFERSGSPKLHVEWTWAPASPWSSSCNGFGLEPRTYHETAEGLTDHCRVVVPSLFGVGRWRYLDVLDAFTRTLNELGLIRSNCRPRSWSLGESFPRRDVDEGTPSYPVGAEFGSGP
jgi:hypothetical protein